MTATPPAGIQKPGVLTVFDNGLHFDEFVVGVTPDNPEWPEEGLQHLMNWAQRKVTVPAD